MARVTFKNDSFGSNLSESALMCWYGWAQHKCVDAQVMP
jgi:hypothetical protein